MEPIFPLEEARINQFCGQLVCAVMQDGTRHVGILTSCGGGRLMLNEAPDCEEAYTEGERLETLNKPHRTARRKARKGKGGPQVHTRAFGAPYGSYGYGPYRPFGPPIGLDLALLALLFLIL
ncbi:hypothetical protein IDH44_18515 [Paenibacillus sp. IB182496]|uniref:Uncharacterized protein n=1 Tax=Paenibacillus sabuli TaxID=2772509 RepID=A0A927BUR5_9BACL|nr:hypothetical protein [Paenibacillus sabuli]MBD2847198.1 hypothetical protein [Paenibacillus sabuli]